MAFRRTFAVTGALALAAALATSSYAQGSAQQENQHGRTLRGDERREFEALRSLVDEVAAGKQPAPADVQLNLQNHFLKGGENVYIPYTLEITGGQFTSYPVAMYVRVVRKNAAQRAAGADAKPQADDAHTDVYFLDVYFLTEKDIVSSGEGAAVRRALLLPPGEYDFYIAMRERQPRGRKAASPKSVVHREALSVPEMTKELMTSTIILAKNLEPFPQKLTPQQQLEQPYTIAGYKIEPIYDAKFPKAGSLFFVFSVHNNGLAASGKPDLDVDYLFYRAAEKEPFSKLATQAFNETTLPGQLDGYPKVFVGQGVPLTTFEPGDYRLEIKITDKTKNQSITRDVPFTVTP